MSSPTTFELNMSLFWRLMKSGPFAGTSAAVFISFVFDPAAGGFMVGFIFVSVSFAFWAMAVALARAIVAAAARKNVRMESTPLLRVLRKLERGGKSSFFAAQRLLSCEADVACLGRSK